MPSINIIDASPLFSPMRHISQRPLTDLSFIQRLHSPPPVADVVASEASLEIHSR